MTFKIPNIPAPALRQLPIGIALGPVWPEDGRRGVHEVFEVREDGAMLAQCVGFDLADGRYLSVRGPEMEMPRWLRTLSDFAPFPPKPWETTS